MTERLIKKKRIILAALAAASLLLLFYFSKDIRCFILVKTAVLDFDGGNTGRAMDSFRKVVKMKPDSPLALDGMGLVYVRLNDFKNAEKYYEAATYAGLKSNGTIDHSKYGGQYLDRGIYKNAQMEFSRALLLNNTDQKALYGMGCCSRAYGDTGAAMEFFRKSLVYSPKNKQAGKSLASVQDDINKGSVDYMFDTNREPMASRNLPPLHGKNNYMLGRLAAHLTGYDSDKHGKSGLEASLASYLPGNSIFLTIDSNIQRVIANAMGSYKGAIVVLRPQTGEILGLYSQPTFSPAAIDSNWNIYSSDAEEPFLNRAFEGLYEPGSIVKVITVSAAIEKGITESSVFPVQCGGFTVLDGKMFWCAEKHGTITSTAETLELSCNIGSAALGLAAGGEALSEYGKRYGFGTLFDPGFFDLSRNAAVSIPVLKSVLPEDHGAKYAIAMQSCGLSPDKDDPFMITPLHAAMLSAAIADNGVMMKPYLIKEIRNVNGKVIYRGVSAELSRPILPATASKLKELMIDVVENGIGLKAKVKGVLVAGKTGTSSGNGRKRSLNAWFISFAPADKPQYAIAVLCARGGKGMDVAAPIAGKIYSELLK